MDAELGQVEKTTMTSGATLHITNGQMANRRLRAAEIHGRFLSWDDPLHHGPVPGGLSLTELSKIRAAFIADNGWSSLDEASTRFQRRNEVLSEAARSKQIVVWSSFELFDQLHLLQLLTWFEQHRESIREPEVVFVEDRIGLGYLEDDQIQQLFESRTNLDAPIQGTGAAIWQAFTAAEPDQLVQWSKQKTPGLPFMTEALERLVCEYPSTDDGLSQTQRQILEVLELGPMRLPNLFRTAQALEARPFMGDWSFWVELRSLIQVGRPALQVVGEQPLLLPPKVDVKEERFRQQRLRLTEFGEKLLAAKTDFMALNRVLRWIGGVEIDHETNWRWDRHQQVVVHPE